jgi:hypothetical protein
MLVGCYSATWPEFTFTDVRKNALAEMQLSLKPINMRHQGP